MRISDWSSDVCSSDLSMRPRWTHRGRAGGAPDGESFEGVLLRVLADPDAARERHARLDEMLGRLDARGAEISVANAALAEREARSERAAADLAAAEEAHTAAMARLAESQAALDRATEEIGRANV